MFKRKTTVDPKAVDYEKLGRQFEKVLISDYVDLLQSTRRQIWMTFIRGVAGGLGGVVGATVMVTFLLFILAQLGGLPYVGEFFRNFAHSLTKIPGK